MGTEFENEVEKLARKMCEELGVDPEPVPVIETIKSNGGGGSCNTKLVGGWKRYESLIRDWLEMEVLNRVKREHWDSLHMKFKEKEPQLLTEKDVHQEDHNYPSLHNWGTEGPLLNEEH